MVRLCPPGQVHSALAIPPSKTAAKRRAALDLGCVEGRDEVLRGLPCLHGLLKRPLERSNVLFRRRELGRQPPLQPSHSSRSSKGLPSPWGSRGRQRRSHLEDRLEAVDEPSGDADGCRGGGLLLRTQCVRLKVKVVVRVVREALRHGG